jgi:hypothetical protein
MSCTDIVKARVTTETKRQVTAAASREMLSESTWLKRLIIREIRTEGAAVATMPHRCNAEVGRRSPSGKSRGCGRAMTVRLRPEDRLLLGARAEARGMRPATYLSVLARVHLRSLAPLTNEEMAVLKRSVAELSAIGRNLNQIARAANEGGRLPASAREEFRAMLKICEGLRDSTKELLKANAASWRTGHAETSL